MPVSDMGIVEQARDWLSQDPDPDTREELQALIDANDVAELERRFAGTLTFGTAGLRAELGAGPLLMNAVVVARAAAGIAAWLLDGAAQHHTGQSQPSAVIGYDARHKSEMFARDSAEILAAAGVRTWLLPSALPTPVLAFAIGHLGCTAGIMVTASHNPPRDNGYKVYEGSAQIVPPTDATIAAHIAAVGRIDQLPRDGSYTVIGPELTADYVTAATAVAPKGPRHLTAVHTALHGVGTDTFERVVRAAGFADIVSVAEQARPDPDFPTVAFPNPEEPGAMDLALATAESCSADIVVANDPDADRCALAARDHGGAMRQLTGDQTGALLADTLLRRGVEGTYVSSIVSSTLLGRLAAAHGQRWQQTLTGFKWIGRVPDIVFGYEEALGYCVAPELSHDKDGITAGLLALELAAELKAEGRTLFDRLGELYAKHGWHLTSQVSVRSDDPHTISELMRRLREDPPTELGGMAVAERVDLAEGWNDLPTTDGIRLVMEADAGDARVIVRPSGTEPKVKCYLEVVRADEASARVVLSALEADVHAFVAG